MTNEERKVLVDILKADKVTMDKLKEENKRLKERILELEHELICINLTKIIEITKN